MNSGLRSLLNVYKGIVRNLNVLDDKSTSSNSLMQRHLAKR